MEVAEEVGEYENVLQKIMDALLKGGYFRARISSLSPFDKLTGGLAWCIIASNADIHIPYDLLFYSDEATLGEKIIVGESIEAALKNMECPYPLQAHQIQGLDYQAVYPVVQWLVKRVLAMREALGDELHRFSHLQFEKHYQLPTETAFKQALEERLKGLSSIKILQQPKRLYRRSRTATIEQDPADSVHGTLLEYGIDISKSVCPAVQEDTVISHDSTSLGIHNSPKEEKSAGRPGSYFLNTIISDLVFSEVDDGFMSKSKVRQLFDLCGEEIQSASANYTLSHDNHVTWKQKAAALLKKIEKQEITIEKCEGELNMAKSSLETLDRSIMEQDLKFGQVKIELNHLNEKVEMGGAASIVETLLSLLQKLKSLEREESDFNNQTSEQMEVEIIKLTSQTLKPEKNVEYEELKSILNSDISKLEALKTELAKKHRAVALLQRRLDDIPTQTELVQFEHRFVEIYEHIQARLRETRRYYGTYNALAEANELTLKEISLLNSINSQKLGKMQATFQAEQSKCNALKAKYGVLLAEQRHYSALVKSFQDECARNEKLRMDLNGLNAPLP
ncbi:uncharacterized protein LOC131079581 isoform X2 [Cryptomeria japonica]|uniref:uncharacterized protein LOC131079581 isoform X2 n=1 Tax=Cryptomeria japonica TaxID=3369 RepID=UPI0027DA556F|nr:uncharacterized protein LOC131079581 isoform X2 [Cryptomeria japonica]